MMSGYNSDNPIEIDENGEVQSVSDSASDDENEFNNDTADVQLTVNAQLTPRAYQLELFKCARKKNSILVLGTGSGKTFIAVLLIKEFADEIRGSICNGNKRTVFVVNTVPLVHQQGLAIKTHTGLKVGQYEGSMGVDYWDDKRWAEELEAHEVIIITAQIFLELILHARLPLRRVNLLIMDECHHAVGNHPMREIMREYDSLKRSGMHECPRILGLTASVINKKCKKDDVAQNMHALELTMDSALVTSVDPEEVLKFTTRPKEILVIYNEDPLSPYQERIAAQLDGLLSEVEEQELDKKVKKFVSKRINNIKHIMISLGDWCVARAIFYEKESLEESADAEEIPVVRDFLERLRARFEEIYDQCVVEERVMENPKDHVSHKVLRLIEILTAIKNDEVAGLIFVERRNIAKILYDFLLELAKANEDMEFIKPLYVIGANTRPGIDLKLAELELRKQRDTLQKFKGGEANFIVSTSVLEEGVDIRKCNAVIRFDKPVNYRAYVQSRGRARAVPSRYILMVRMADHVPFINDLDVYREIEKTLLKLCHDRDLPSVEETHRHFDEDDLLPPYQPYGPQGPKVTANSAISLINHYIGKLPQDRFTTLAPEVVYTRRDDKIQAGILLPRCLILKDFVRGDFEENTDLAKKSAALHLCRTLHQKGELDHKLRPAVPSEEKLAEDLLDLTLESRKEGEPDIGTKKHRQIYTREVYSSFRHSERTTFYLYSVEVRSTGDSLGEITIDSTKLEDTVGIMCKKALLHCPFNLYGPKIGEVNIKIKLLEVLRDVTIERIRNVEHFHKLAIESILPINNSLMEFNPREFDSGLFIVPLKHNSINFELMDNLSSLSTIRGEVPVISSQTYKFERASFQNAVVYPLYGDKKQMHYVTNIMDDLSPRSEFPENKMLYENYEGYFLAKYGATITNRQQPLISVKHLPKELNYLKKNLMKKKGNREPPYFIPELCGILPLSASLWWQLSCVPSILYRLNSFGLAHELSLDIGVSSVLNLSSISDHSLDFDWTVHATQIIAPDTNLAVVLSQKRNECIYPFMLAQALTLMAANDAYNLERLEVLGDAFLKYAVGEYVYLKFPGDHEGKLSARRTLLVCNKTLFQLAKRMAIPEKIQAINLQPRINGFLPGFGVKKYVERELLKLGYPSDKWHKLPIPENISDLGQVIKQLEDGDEHLNDNKATDRPIKASCFNPWREHEVSDKSVADCAEALIGAYLLQCGAHAAKDFLHWMGIGVHKGERLLKDGLFIRTAILDEKKSWAAGEVLSFYRKACLDRLEDIIQYKFKDRSFIVQSVTHPSYISNRTTDSYQRLEFIGDAVLDYLVTGLIYSRHTSYTPGQMTDLRSYYVNNETLARVAAKYELQKHLLHMAPKLQAVIDKFLQLCQEEGLERELVTEDGEDDVEEIEVPKCLGDLIEALIGAVYMDSNRDLKVTWDVVLVLMGDVFKKNHTNIPKNCVRQLYEMAGSVEFEKENQDGLAKCIVKVDDKFEVVGLGKNFKIAKDNAAKKALRRLQGIGF